MVAKTSINQKVIRGIMKQRRGQSGEQKQEPSGKSTAVEAADRNRADKWDLMKRLIIGNKKNSQSARRSRRSKEWTIEFRNNI